MLRGLVAPIPTMFDATGGIDAAKNSRFTHQLCDAGVDHIFVLGSLGEFPSVRDRERAIVLESVIESLSRMADAWVGCGAPSTPQAVERAIEAEELGAEALVAVPPFYLRPTAEAIEQYYRAIRAATRMPLLAYNIPSLVGYALPPALVHHLARDKILDGIKDTSGTIESVHAFQAGAPEGFPVLPGDDALAAEALLTGSPGAVMGTANIVPKLAHALVTESLAGNRDRAVELQRIVDGLVGVIRAGPFPGVDKFLAERLRGCEVGYRAPYGPLTDVEKAKVESALAPIEPDLKPFL
ncbi:MAG: dihydrodipicolinate synthase family protein [Thermoplasmata archaeon]|nr:dihydrodipicolinate synthase family protein [Thermoplasmata archaeon]